MNMFSNWFENRFHALELYLFSTTSAGVQKAPGVTTAKAAGVVDYILALEDFISVTGPVPALGKGRVEITVHIMRFIQRIIFAFEASLCVKTMAATG